jgi:hypothetical protein
MTRKRLYATVVDVPRVKSIKYLDETRVKQAMVDSGRFATDAALDALIGKSPQVGRWKRKESTPAGETLELMCYVLSATPAYLFGRSDDEIRAYLMRTVSRELGEDLAKVLRMMLDIAPARRQHTVEVIRVMLEQSIDDDPYAVIEPWQLDSDDDELSATPRSDDDAEPPIDDAGLADRVMSNDRRS